MHRPTLIFQSLFAGALTLSLTACGGGARHDPTEAYYLVTPNLRISYWQTAAAGFDKAGREMKVRFETVGPKSYDPKGQRDEFRKVVAQRNPTGILVSAADPNLLAPEIDAAIAKGVPVITIDADAPNSRRLAFIGADNYNIGRMGGKLVADHLQGKGVVVIFTMPEQANLKERLHGYEAAFREYPGITIAEVVDIKGQASAAYDKTQAMVEQKTPVDAFVCLVSVACPDVAEVLDRNKVEGKTVVAMDTDPRTIEWIRKGRIAATIAQKPFTMAYLGLQMLDQLQHAKPASLQLDWAHDLRSPVPAFVDTGALLVDKTNVDAFLTTSIPDKVD